MHFSDSSGGNWTQLGSGFSSSSRRGKEQLVVFDERICNNIWTFYNEIDPFITICKEVVYEHTLKGGVSLKWGSLERKFITDQEGNFKDFMETALDYYKMFGFCPVKINKKDGVKFPSIPSYGNGGFGHYTNPKTEEEEVIYIPRNKEKHDGDYFVFVWPNKSPAKNSTSVTSDIYKVFGRFLFATSFEENSADADYEASHPPLFFRRDYKEHDIRDMTEDRLFGLVKAIGEDAVTPDMERTYKQSIASEMILEKVLERQRKGADGSERQALDPQTKTAKTVKRSTEAVDRATFIGDYSIGGQLNFSQRDDHVNIRSKYEDLVCEAMGVPKSYFDRSSKVYKSDAINDQHFLKTTVERMRSNTALFLRAVYNALYSEDDTEYLIDFYLEVDKTSDGDKNKKQAQIKGALDSKNRIEIVFPEDSFSHLTPMADIISLWEMGVITPLEYANASRSKAGLKPIKDNDPILIEIEKKRQLKEEMDQLALEEKKKSIEEGPSDGKPAAKPKEKEKEKTPAKPKEKESKKEEDKSKNKGEKRKRKE
jgi:hypothetical protein